MFFENNKLNFPELWTGFPETKDNQTPVLTTIKDIDESQREIYKKDLKCFHGKNNILSEEVISHILSIKGNLRDISKAQGILWSDELIERYIEFWDWSALLDNSSLLWTKNRINKFEKQINFKRLSYKTNVEFDYELVKKYEDYWDWNALSGNPKVMKNIETSIISHKKIVWVSKPYHWYDQNRNNDLSELNSVFDSCYSPSFGIEPCVCTCPSIYWTLEKFEKYKDKIDFWLLAMFGNLDNEIILKYGNELNENRFYRTEFTRYSDWRDEHPVYRNGWENLNLNMNFRLNFDLINHLFNKTTNLIEYGGDARSGHSEEEISRSIIDLFETKKLNIDFKDLCNIESKLPNKFLSENFIDYNIYMNIIRPVLIKEPSLISELIEVF